MTLEAVPPGQQPTSTTPSAKSGGKLNIRVSSQAVPGMMVNCAMLPIITSLGRVNTTLKSSGLSVSPMPNITSPSKGLIAVGFTQLKVEGLNSERPAEQYQYTHIAGYIVAYLFYHFLLNLFNHSV